MKTKCFPFIVLLVVVLAITSCRTEDDLSIDPPAEQGIEADSKVADLLKRTAKKDGSFDNIIDKASCLSIQLPVSLTVNGVNITINTIENYDEVEDILDLFSDDADKIELDYPVTVILEDFTTVEINSDEELAALAAKCSDENEDDDDIECIDIQYPITASVFNQNNEVVATLTLSNDKDLYEFIDDLEDYAAATINFPINIILSDGTEVSISGISALEEAIDQAKDSCDEDDDYDYNDDDCDSCSTDQLAELFDSCSNFYIDKLELNNADYEDNYEGYFFDFSPQNTILVTKGSTQYSGTWEASGTANSIRFVIAIPDLPQVSDTWNVHELEKEVGEAKIDLRKGDDRLRFESDCDQSGGGGQTSELKNILSDGKWIVASYKEEEDDQTADYAGFEIDFKETGNVIATNGSITNEGTWAVIDSGNAMKIDFDSGEPFNELNDEDWEVVSVKNTRVELKDVSGGDDSVDILVFEKI